MKYNKIILAGGNGYLGKVLTAYYRDKATEIVILSRSPKAVSGNVKTLVWDGKTPGDWVSSLQGAQLLINLCGKNVNCRYNKKNRAEIFASRLIPTKLLGDVIEKMEQPPQLWINITSATIYRHAEDRPQDDLHGEIGSGFSVDVCTSWEQTFFATHTPKTRKVALRMGIVLGISDSAFPYLLRLVKFGLGGHQGNGRQYVNWVHQQDAAKCTEWVMENPDLNGSINCVAPYPATNNALMRTIRKVYGMPFGLPAPAWLLRIGALVIGTDTELILKSRWVLPTRLLNSGYQFLFPKAEDAVKDILSGNK
ncbi:hypothetical protein BDD43_2621 [Mucilaginibacter gracilis]|uniref:Uncharacterized protein n=1 Tax=Mucilaginibacter gracilis TaxID=423350 RepID=A0A495J1D9_9SPHI|nr:TIGR01777 family oxidoreductase [Mucilaginibacter gracilis]RKR82441.1 hypothetical protein BDD43_2621 [Mucilaginibacter gracilis]